MTIEAVKVFVERAEKAHEDLPEFKISEDAFGAWSISKLKVLQKCPFQFYLKYVLKLKVPDEMQAQDTLSADLGTAIHRVLELLMVGKSVDLSFDTAKKEFVPKKLSEEQWETEIKAYRHSVVAFKQRMEQVDERYGIGKVFTELRVGVTKDWESTGFFSDDCYFRGVIDLALQTSCGNLLIIDHKRGGTPESSIRPYEPQLNSYKPLFHFGVKKIKGAQSFIHFVNASEVKPSRYHDQAEIEKDLITALNWDIEGAADRVKDIGYFKHVAHPGCKWCEYASACKSTEKLMKPLELSTKDKIIKKG